MTKSTPACTIMYRVNSSPPDAPLRRGNNGVHICHANNVTFESKLMMLNSAPGAAGLKSHVATMTQGQYSIWEGIRYLTGSPPQRVWVDLWAIPANVQKGYDLAVQLEHVDEKLDDLREAMEEMRDDVADLRNLLPNVIPMGPSD